MHKLYFLLLLTFLPLGAQKVYKTPSGSKYHLSTCRMVKNVSSEVSLRKALEMGLSACKICNPPYSSSYGAVSATQKVHGENSKSRCRGITKAGTRCKHYTRIGNDYCYQHQP